jgi:hypothetical protein
MVDHHKMEAISFIFAWFADAHARITLLKFICRTSEGAAEVRHDTIRVRDYCQVQGFVCSVMKFQARNLPDRIFCRTYAEVSNLRHAVP